MRGGFISRGRAAAGLIAIALAAVALPALAQPAADQVVRLRFVHSGRCLDLAGLAPDNGGTVQQFACNGGPNQMVRLRAASGVSADRFQLVLGHSGRCLDVPSGLADAGIALQQYDCHAGPNQVFRLRSVGGSRYAVENVQTGKCLDVRGATRGNGAIVQQFGCHDGENQLVTIEDGGFRAIEWLCDATGESGPQLDGSFIYNADYVRLLLSAAFGWPQQRARDLELALQSLSIRRPDEGVAWRQDGPNLYRDHPYLMVIGIRIQPFVPNGTAVWATSMEAQDWARGMVYGQSRTIPPEVGRVRFTGVSNRADRFELLGAAIVAMESDNLSWPSVRGLVSDLVTAIEVALSRTFECPRVLARPLPGDALTLRRALGLMMTDVQAHLVRALQPPIVELASFFLRTGGNPDEFVGYQLFTFCALEAASDATPSGTTDAICRPLPLPATTLRFDNRQTSIPIVGTSAAYDVTLVARELAAPVRACPVPPRTGPRRANRWTSSAWTVPLAQARATLDRSSVDASGRAQVDALLGLGRAVAVFFADNDFSGAYWIEPAEDASGQLRGMTALNRQRPAMDDEVDSLIFLVPDGQRVLLEVYEDALDTGRYDDSVVRICGSAVLSNLNHDFGDRYDVGMGGDEMTSFRFTRP